MNIVQDNTTVYKQQIEPLVREIRCLCNENKIPYFAAFGVKMADDGSFRGEGGFINSALLPEVMEIPSNDPRFVRMINVMNGFHTVLRGSDHVNVDDDMCPMPDIE